MPKTIPADVWRSLRHEWLWVYCGQVPRCEVWSAEIPVPPGVFFVERGEVRIRADGVEIVVPRDRHFSPRRGCGSIGSRKARAFCPSASAASGRMARRCFAAA
jgi:hypothetical protein